MRENLNINMLKVYVNYKTLFIERQYMYIDVTCARQFRSSNLLAGKPLNNMSTL